MHLAWIALSGFRSYSEMEWRPEAGINLLVGENGAGKSNLMEAIGYLASLKSFRSAPDEALVGFDVDSAVVRGEVGGEQAPSLIEIEIRRRGGRRAFVNKSRLVRAADLLGHVRAVTFLPEDLDIVKRGPAHRRDLLDDVAVQLGPAAHLDQTEFDRALRQRNAFLKQRVDDELTLAVWDERLAQSGAKVMARRARAAVELAGTVATSYVAIAAAAASVEFEYASDWGGELDASISVPTFQERLVEALARSRRVDRERGVTTVGPHRDEPVLLLDGHDARFHASQGEQRTTALSLRLATHHAVAERTGTSPLLLLDDVFSELDPHRAEALASSLPAAQTLITTADRGDVPIDGRVWQVDQSGLR
jgi:DNA replication and repair protein RecF